MAGFPFGRPKYGNRKLDTPDGKFDSKREYGRWLLLKRMQENGIISGLRRQVTYYLAVNGITVCRYIADFAFLDAAGDRVVEDAKGFKTPEYKLKKKLMAACLGIEIVEI